jgi:hypothetical protein
MQHKHVNKRHDYAQIWMEYPGNVIILQLKNFENSPLQWSKKEDMPWNKIGPEKNTNNSY